MEIKILGSGCPKCQKLEKFVKIAIQDLKLNAKIIKVTNYEDIVSYGVMGTPALVVDGVVKFAGMLPSVGKLKKILLTC
ncbi:MAG: TM0996/MTH895 family glutaredoxin-like protein [Candidatus Izimaplasma sp.]|nr:TM0996/MTH895 family glutaredoxin-like protein [Candidatus Izimaplasma bacterium]